MRGNLRGTLWRLAAFLAVCLFGMFAMFAVFGQLRFDSVQNYKALFSNISGLKEGSFVRIAGVEVGKVRKLAIQPDTTVLVEFAASPSVFLTQGTRAVIRYDDVIGGRYLALEKGDDGSANKLHPGDTIPLARTSPALDLDALIGGFRPLFRALDPDQVNALSSQLIRAFQGQGAIAGSFLSSTAMLTNTLADRDDLIGQVIDNLNTVLGSLAEQSQQFDKAVTSVSDLVAGLESRKRDISNAVAYGNEAASSFADLLSQARPPLQKVVHETDRSSGIVVADHDYMDNLLNTLPDAYRLLGRQGLYGDFFSFYMCQMVLKLNGKGGQPVYVKLVGQTAGRCAPK
ncbi:MCE family protein [Mycobacterium sp. URHB0044]|jgi:phospholipid/cholesterol/gamma-HCH transport system substrate-binding protein|uniref:MCE family protein n=1 Tax=Mycobacterium sp. URHB0044 TaxID=1380386 RepID=UPI00048BC204|nr:MCE family protein [Mycobacterium sp. URHB0044]